MNSVIRLFKAVPVKTKETKEPDLFLLLKTVKRGFIFSPNVVANYSKSELDDLIVAVEKEIGISADKANNTFHKSWKKIKEASIEQLVVEQILHYFSTYGAEALGIYDSDSVYIPNEKLEIPDLEEGIKLTVIQGYTKAELKEKLMKMLQLGVALKESTIKDVIDVAVFVDIDEDDIGTVKNKEVKIMLYDYFGMFPVNPTEFLRFLIYKSTNKTLLIKNKKTIEEIKLKAEDNLAILGLLNKYEKKHGLENLAEIFYRFKPLFLAFRLSSKSRTIINKIRRLAVKNHKPMKVDYLNDVTAKIKRGKKIDTETLRKELIKSNTFRKVRLAYALKFRTGDVDSILYRVRNGKGYATDFCFRNKKKLSEILDIVIESISEDIGKNVKDKKIFIPKNVNYTLPATEKQFTGNLPSGTSVSIPKDMIFGVHWTNLKGKRIDLDLSLINASGTKFGWDGAYRNQANSILFSGDITDAPRPKGATELFYVAKQKEGNYILSVNNFTYYDNNKSVPFKILVAEKHLKSLDSNYMVDPNNIICVSKTEIAEGQKTLGLVQVDEDKCTFYFAETSTGKSISSGNSTHTQQSRDYLFNFYKGAITLNEVLAKSGAIMVEDKEECDIDLSPESLEKDTILNLLGKS